LHAIGVAVERTQLCGKRVQNFMPTMSPVKIPATQQFSTAELRTQQYCCWGKLNPELPQMMIGIKQEPRCEARYAQQFAGSNFFL
jgi:hypothetical protein